MLIIPPLIIPRMTLIVRMTLIRSQFRLLIIGDAAPYGNVSSATWISPSKY